MFKIGDEVTHLEKTKYYTKFREGIILDINDERAQIRWVLENGNKINPPAGRKTWMKVKALKLKEMFQ